MVTSTITAPAPIWTPSTTVTGKGPGCSRVELPAHLGDLLEHIMQRLEGFGVDRNVGQCRELGDRSVHRLDGVRGVTPSSGEQPHPERPRLVGNLGHARA